MKRYIAGLILGIIMAAAAQAQSFRVPSNNDGRAGDWEFTIQLQTNAADTYNGKQQTSIRLNQRTGFGFGAAYNLTEHFSLGADLNFSSPRYTATIQPQEEREAAQSFQNRADIVTGQFKGTWNILKSSLTPYIEAGGGFTFVDSNVRDTQVPVTCWYDPWYGTVCNTSSYNDTNFSYGGAAGFRWDTKNSMVLKLSINTLTIDTSDDPTINSIRFEIGARY